MVSRTDIIICRPKPPFIKRGRVLWEVEPAIYHMFAWHAYEGIPGWELLDHLPGGYKKYERGVCGELRFKGKLKP